MGSILAGVSSYRKHPPAAVNTKHEAKKMNGRVNSFAARINKFANSMGVWLVVILFFVIEWDMIWTHILHTMVLL